MYILPPWCSSFIFSNSILNLEYDDHFPANSYLFQVNNRNITKRCEICSKLTIETSKRGHQGRFDVFIVNF